MEWDNPGLIGGIVGSLVGIAGGILGTWASIKNTRTPEERQKMVKLSVFVWSAIILLIAVPLALSLAGIIPKWIYWICFGIFFILLMSVILKSARNMKH